MSARMKWAGIVLFGCFCLAYVWIRIDLVLIGYDLERLTKRKAALEREHEGLQMRFSQLTSPRRIAKEARKKLGLDIPRRGQIVVVAVEPPPAREGDSVTERIQLAERRSEPR